MCSKKSHVSRDRPGKDAFRPEVIAYLEAALASDIAVYDCALRAHETQTAAHGANFTAALRLFGSAAFKESCKSIAVAAHKHSTVGRRKSLLEAAAAERQSHHWNNGNAAAADAALNSSQVIAMLDGKMEVPPSSSRPPHYYRRRAPWNPAS